MTRRCKENQSRETEEAKAAKKSAPGQTKLEGADESLLNHDFKTRGVKDSRKKNIIERIEVL